MMDPKGRYDSLIQFVWSFYEDKYGKDPAVDWRLFKALVQVESAFNPKAISSVGARGLCQIMRDTWGPGFDNDAFNPEANLHRGCEYLWSLWKVFRQEKERERWAFALGSYNAGMGNILKCQAVLQARNKRTDKWENIVEILPKITGEHAQETIGYVEKIMLEYTRMTGGLS